jgi:hypothetical protein
MSVFSMFLIVLAIGVVLWGYSRLEGLEWCRRAAEETSPVIGLLPGPNQHSAKLKGKQHGQKHR